MLDLTELTHKARTEVNRLSRGMSQRLSIARVLLHDPKVLLLDEPASGLDPRARIEIRELLKELRRMGKTIIISSHILHELAELCNTVGIIEQGSLLFSGTTEEIMAKSNVGQVVHLTVADRVQDAMDLMAKVPGVTTVDLLRDREEPVIEVTIDGNVITELSDLPSRLVASGFRIRSFQPEPRMETAFMRLTKGGVLTG